MLQADFPNSASQTHCEIFGDHLKTKFLSFNRLITKLIMRWI